MQNKDRNSREKQQQETAELTGQMEKAKQREIHVQQRSSVWPWYRYQNSAATSLTLTVYVYIKRTYWASGSLWQFCPTRDPSQQKTRLSDWKSVRVDNGRRTHISIVGLNFFCSFFCVILFNFINAEMFQKRFKCAVKAVFCQLGRGRFDGGGSRIYSWQNNGGEKKNQQKSIFRLV